MNFSGVYQREKRNPNMYHPMHNSIASYWTESLHKNEMKHEYVDDYILQNIHLIPDPLKKNLADTLFSTNTPDKSDISRQEPKMTHENPKVPSKNMSSEKHPQEQSNASFGGMRSFFAGVMNVLTSVVFRSRSPVNYYDCFDVDAHQGSPTNWQSSKTDVQDKNGQAAERKTYDASPYSNVSTDMNSDKATVINCETKLNQVLHLLSAPKQTSNPVWVRKRPKKVFVEPGSVSESFEDAFSPEDFGSVPNDSYIEYYSPVQYHCEELYEAEAPKIKLSVSPIKENTDIVKDVINKSDLELKRDDEKLNVQNTDNSLVVNQETGNVGMQLEQRNIQLVNNEPQSQQIEQSTQNHIELKDDFNIGKELINITPNDDVDETDNVPIKCELISSCEDKLSRLKALLQEKRMKCKQNNDILEARKTPPKTIPVDTKPADKHFKNPNRRCNKRSKSKLKCRIEDDLLFANEINTVGTPPSVENSPSHLSKVCLGEYFDEVSGRFRTVSTGSDDSFQIVFNDSSKPGRVRTTSDCDSDDSFIVFEDSPDCCYTTTDVFGDSDSESEMSDSGCGMVTCKLAHTLTRTVSNLADDSLYAESEDEVDFANVEPVSVISEQKCGLLIDDTKKLMRKCLPVKKVQFDDKPPKVHVMRVWAFAARQARAGHWERYAVDRERFKRRIADVDVAVSWVLKPQHRSRVMFQRFMPWWNQLKRKELAERKEREAEEKRQEELKKKEQERLEAEKDSIKEVLIVENGTLSTDEEKDDNEQLNKKEISVIEESDADKKEELRIEVKAEDKLLECNNNKGDFTEGNAKSNLSTQHIKVNAQNIPEVKENIVSTFENIGF